MLTYVCRRKPSVAFVQLASLLKLVKIAELFKLMRCNLYLVKLTHFKVYIVH